MNAGTKFFPIIFLCLVLGNDLNFASMQPQQKPASQTPASEWVVYATEVGWLRVGTRDEFAAKWQKKDEIWGGTAETPLLKNLILEGFGSRDQAVTSLCSKLTKVQLHIAPPALGAPTRYLSAVYDDKEYNLRLTEGFDREAVEAMSKGGFFKGLEYDWEAEWALLQQQNITPRYIFPGRQWLIHATGRGTRQGPESLDRWMCFTQKPDVNGSFTIPLEDGTTQTYSSDLREGPFRDNFTLARVMKKHGITTIDLWPQVTSIIGRDVQPRVEADRIPDNPKDYGDAVLPYQPIMPDKNLEDWVIYEVEGGWLHVGTRYEYAQPLAKKEVIWLGSSDEPAVKTLLAPTGEKKFYSYRQALADLSANLSDVSTQYHPMTEPRETINANYRGKPYKLKIERGVDGGEVLEYRSFYYDYGTIWRLLAENKITPRRTFAPARLVHATGHGTYSGPVKDDMWMLVAAGAVQPDGKSMILPDGMGGTFGYSIDYASAEVKSNYELAPILRQVIGSNPALQSTLGAIGIPTEDRGVRADEVPPNPQNQSSRPEVSRLTLIAIKPDKANQGNKLGVRILASGIDKGCKLDFGDGIQVSNLVFGGRDADTEYEQWWCTLEISSVAAKGKRNVKATNADGGTGTLANGFEVIRPVGDLCSPIRLVVPAAAPLTVPKLTKQFSTETISVKSELASLAEQQQRLWPVLKDTVAQMLLLDQGQDERRKALWQERLFLEKKIREAEDAFAQLLARCPQVISDAEFGQIRTSLLDRVGCLAETRATALDNAREVNVFYKYSEYQYKAKAYESARDNLLHTLEWWQHFNSLRLFKLQEQLKTERFAQLKDGNKISSKKLRPLQRQVRDTFIDMGRVALWYSQANIEDALFQQDTYLAAWNEVSQQSKNIEEANTLKARAAQRLIFSLKYLNSVAYGLAFGGSVDVGKRIVNSIFSGLQLTEPFANTVSKDITLKISESREKSRSALQALDQIQGFSDEETANLRNPAGVSAPELQYFLQDRLFAEQTSGGLLRLAACYDASVADMMASELNIAIQHARLNARDLRTTLNLAEGATPAGEYERWKRVLTNPLGTVQTFMQNALFDRFSTTEAWVAEREIQVKQMQDLQTLLQKMNYGIDIEAQLSFLYPKTFQIHHELQQLNPDYLQFLMEYRRLAAQSRLETLVREYGQKALPMAPEYLDEIVRRNYRYVAYLNSEDQARLFQLQGLDRMVIWDLDGALEYFYQAYESDPQLITLAKLETLRQDFAWLKTVNAGTETAVQLGNMGMHTALFAWMGNSFGELFGIAPAPSLLQSAAAGQLSATQFLSGFADFVWTQMNPFASLTRAVALRSNWEQMVKSLSETKWLVEQTILTQDILAPTFLWLGAEREYADFMANALVNTAFHRLANENSVLKEAINKLREVEIQFNATSVDIRLWNQRQTARQSFFDEMGLLKAMRELDERQQQLRSGQKPASSLDAITNQIGQLKIMVLNRLAPVTETELKQRYDLFEQRMGQIAPGAEAMTKRLKLIADFFQENPLDRMAPLFRNKSTSSQLYRELGKNIDQLRLLLIDAMESKFLSEHPEFASYFEAYVHNGSWANPDLPGYKYLTSDLDLNILIKRDTPASKRAEIKNAFDQYFRSQSGLPPEAIKMTTFVDVEPMFRATGEDVAGFFATIRNTEARAQLQREIGENLDALSTNLGEGERYFLRGSLFYLQFMNKFCRVKRLSNGTLTTDPDGARIYQNLKFAPWMGFDLALGQLPFINKARTGYPNDHFAYMKQLDKYALRVLLGMMVQYPRGLHELHRIDQNFVQQAGGIEQVLVKVVENIGRQPDPTQPVNSSLSEQAALQAGLRTLGLAPEHSQVLKEWLAVKEGNPVSEVFSQRAGKTITDPNDPQLNALSARHIMETEALVRSIVEKTLIGQATFLKQLETAMKVEPDPAIQQVIKDKMLEILYSQAAVWGQLSREQQLWVLKNSPPEAEYWQVIAELDRIRATASQSNWQMLFKTWQPTVVIRDDVERKRLSEEYQKQALNGQVARLLDTQFEL